MTVPQRSEAEKVLVIACGMLAREVLAVKEQLALDHLDVVCLPAELHFHPERIPPAADAALAKAKRDGYDRVFLAYGDCGTGGGLDAVCARHGAARIAGPHCFAFYQGLKRFEAIGDGDMRTFYVTDFLCRQFDAFFIRPLGLDRHPELAADYFRGYEKLVYLAQTEDPELETVAQRAASMLGLAYERRLTGYGDLTPALESAGAS